MTPGRRAQLLAYLGLLEDAGRELNLTRIPAHLAWERHIEEALALLAARSWKAGERVIDLGSGGGVPGIPLAIARPDLACILVEKSPRKCAVLRRMAGHLQLRNVAVVARSAETLAGDATMPPVDVVVSRAAAPPSELLRLAMPLLRPGGALVAHVGRTAAVGPDLLAAARRAGAGRPEIRVVPPVRLLMTRRQDLPAALGRAEMAPASGVRSSAATQPADTTVVSPGSARMDMQATNRRVIEQFRAGGPVEGMQRERLLLLTTVGRRSGQRRTTPMMFHRDGQRLVVIASNMGAPRHPGWYRNLRARSRVTVELGAEVYEAAAAPLRGDDRRRVWATLKATYPFFADHEAQTHRTIPVVELRRWGDSHNRPW